MFVTGTATSERCHPLMIQFFFLMNRFQRQNFHQRKVNKLKASTPISLAFHMTLLDQPQLRTALLNKKQQA